jgi:hypothetical protein
MAAPLSPSKQIQNVGDELEKYIKEASSGKEDSKALFKIQKKLATLKDNPDVPESVRHSLQAVLAELKHIESLGGGISGVSALKTAKLHLDQVDKALTSEKSEGGFLGKGEE